MQPPGLPSSILWRRLLGLGRLEAFQDLLGRRAGFARPRVIHHQGERVAAEEQEAGADHDLLAVARDAKPQVQRRDLLLAAAELLLRQGDALVVGVLLL